MMTIHEYQAKLAEKACGASVPTQMTIPIVLDPERVRLKTTPSSFVGIIEHVAFTALMPL